MRILKALDAAFRNVVPEFEDFVVASRNDVKEVCTLHRGLGIDETHRYG